MSTDLEQALRTSAADLTLDTPAADVLARGDHLRRRRRRGLALAASGAMAVAAVAAIGVTALDGQQPDRPSVGATAPEPAPEPAPAFQVASWSGPTTNLSAGQLADVQAECGTDARRFRTTVQGATEPGWHLAGTTLPVAAELRDDLVLAYFRQGRDYATCALETTDGGGFQVTAQSAGVEETLPSGRHVSFATAGAADPGPLGGTLADVYVVARTSADVGSVEIHVAGETYTSAADGLALFWLPDDVLTQADLDRATVTALDEDGDVLGRSRGELW
ncbi:hypothetical protein [Nocardioides dongkuii]|uniref:hypothetical protein n=1 Tax=Nocardioides dongkuii TaxID=2760089 RepID=UPI0015FB6526|nr:hypothetical protein [Nocardioides dongkuii]